MSYPVRRRNRTQAELDDAAAAALYRVSNISTPAGRLFRYDPATGRTEDVLAEIPIDVIVRDLMVRLLNREPNDPRGLYRDLPHDANLLGLLDE